MDNERIPENERLQIEQIRDLETEVLQVEEVDDHSSGDNSEWFPTSLIPTLLISTIFYLIIESLTHFPSFRRLSIVDCRS